MKWNEARLSSVLGIDLELHGKKQIQLPRSDVYLEIVKVAGDHSVNMVCFEKCVIMPATIFTIQLAGSSRG